MLRPKPRLLLGLMLLILALLISAPGLTQGPRPWLGVVLGAADSQGVPITEVIPGSPAEASNLSTGDHVLQIEGKDVHTPKELIDAIASYQPGQTARLTILRAGRRYQASAVLAPMPSGEELLRRQRVGKPAPAFVGLAAVPGATVPSLSALRGRVVVVDFWAPWCLPCRLAIPHLNTWATRLGARGLSLVGVGTDEVDVVAAGAQAWGIGYPIVADPAMKTWRAYGIREAPSLLVIDRRGVVRDVATGFDRARMAALETLIDQLLREPVPSP